MKRELELRGSCRNVQQTLLQKYRLMDETYNSALFLHQLFPVASFHLNIAARTESVPVYTIYPFSVGTRETNFP